MQVEFSEIARQTLIENIEFLNKVWTKREVTAFLNDIKELPTIWKKENIFNLKIHPVK